jgi:hypothetical protein
MRKPLPPVTEVTLKPGGEVVLTPKEAPAKQPEHKRIHPRRPMPPIPDAAPKESDGPEKNDQSGSVNDG